MACAAAEFASCLPPRGISAAYAAFLVSAALVAYFLAGMEVSVLLTFGGMAQSLATILLCMAWCSGGAAVSGQTAALSALSVALRLSSTVWLNGYLPADKTGDWFYQAVDVCTLIAALALLSCVAEECGGRLPRPCESWRPCKLGVAAALLLAALLHGDMDGRPLFDTAWLAGHFLAAAAPLPQLRVAMRAQATAVAGLGEDCVRHAIGMFALGQLCCAVYIWMAREDLTCQPWVPGFSHSTWAILAAPLIHLALVCDVVPPLASMWA